MMDTGIPLLDSGGRVRMLLVAAVDALLVNAATILAFLARFSGHLPPVNFQAYIQLVGWMTLIRMGTFYFSGLYEDSRDAHPFSVFYSVFTAVTLSSILIVAVTFFYERSLPFPRTVFLISWLFNILIIGAWHSYVHYLRTRAVENRRLLVVGPAGVWEKVREELAHAEAPFVGVNELRYGRTVKEFLEAEDGSLAGVTDVLCADRTASRMDQFRFISECQRRQQDVWVVPDASQVSLGRTAITHVGDTPLLRVQSGRLRGRDLVVKGLIDWCLGLAALLLTLPLMPMLALMVVLDSAGPVLFRQERVGLGGHVYRVFKFRTMVTDAEAGTGPVLAVQDDSRVTRVGSWLRRSRLDELPQIFNVFKGDMSLVGPRPERPLFVNRFLDEVPGYARRLVVKPGMTGLAQIYGRYDTSAENKLAFDLAYVSNWSILLDLEIMFMTVEVMLRGAGAH